MKLTYSADWNDDLSPWAFAGTGLPLGTGNLATQVSFASELDSLGIDVYAPLSNAANPTLAQLIAGWTQTPTVLATLAVTHGASLISYFESVAAAVGKPLIFSEIGYEDATDAASSPAGSSTNVVDPALQAELYQAFFQAWQQAGNSSLTGVYFWNWDPNSAEVGPGQPANFSPQGLPAQGVVTSWFSPPSATAATDDGAVEVGVGHVVTITLKTGEAETVAGVPTLQLNDGDVATYVGGSGTNTLQFSYVVQPGDAASDLQVTGLNLSNGATIQDSYGNILPNNVAADLGLQVITVVANLQSSEDHLVYLLYQASFDRIPDYAGFEYWAGQADARLLSALQLADIFMAAPEFAAKFGANPSNDAYVTELYTNVLGRTPDAAGLAYWEAQANAGTPRDQLLVAFATSAENLQTTAPHTAHGYWVS